MIGVEGQYFLKVSIGGEDDVIAEEDLILLKLQEETGNVLPRFELVFLSSDQSLITKLNEGNDVTLVMGRSQTDDGRIEAKMQIVIPNENKDSGDKRRIHLLGVYKNLVYTTNPSTEITDKMTGMEVVQKYASQNWEVDIQPSTSDDDKMPWMKQFTTNKKMVDKALEHLHLEKGVPICGITCQGKFIVRNIEDLKSQSPKWNFTRDPKGGTDMFYDSNPQITNESTFNNTVNNYGRSVRVFDTIKGISKVIEYKGKPQLAQTPSLPRSKDIKMIPGATEFRTDNVHKDWELSRLKNSTELTSLSSVRASISVPGVFFPVEVVDPVTISDTGIGPLSSLINDLTSGSRIVTKICRIIANRQFSTYIEMVVESVNSPQGSFLDLGGIDAIADSLCASAFSLISPAKSIVSDIAGSLADTLTAPFTALQEQVTEVIQSIPKPELSIVVDTDIADITLDVSFDLHLDQLPKVGDVIDSFEDGLSKVIDDAASNLCGAGGSMVKGMGRFMETPLAFQRSDGQESVGLRSLGDAVSYTGRNENTITMYNQPPEITSIPRQVIQDTFRDIADSFDIISTISKNSLISTIQNMADKIITEFKEDVSRGLSTSIVQNLLGIDPSLDQYPEGLQYLEQVGQEIDTVVSNHYQNPSIIFSLISKANEILETLDQIVQNCNNALRQVGESPSDLSSLFPTDVKPGVMTPSTVLDVWRCDDI